MPSLRSASLADLSIEDERSFHHVGLYRELKRAMVERDLRFLVAVPGGGVDRYEDTLLLNLAFWHPDEVSEVLVDELLTADQLAHNAWHRLANEHLEEHARTADGILFAESVASAFDVYLVGRLVGNAPDAEFLESQVPAMREAAEAAGLDEAGFAALVAWMQAEPERAFEELRQLLFDTTTALVAAHDIHHAAAVLEAQAKHRMAPLLHHYELPTWVLYARAYGTSRAPCEQVRSFDRELRGVSDPLALLEERWLASANSPRG